MRAVTGFFTAFVMAGPWWLKIVAIAPLVTYTIVHAIGRLRRPGRPGGRHEG